MIRIPELPAVQASAINAPDARQDDMRLAAANAPNAALGGPVAEAIGGIGEAFQSVADQAQKFENARQESEARVQLDSSYLKFQSDLQNDPDPVSRLSKTRQFFEQSKSIADNPNLSPQVRDNLRQFHADFKHKGTLRAHEDAAALTLKRAGLQLTNEREVAKANRDRAAHGRSMDTGEAAGLILPEERVALERDFDESVSRTTLDLAIDETPADVAKDIERPDFYERMPGITPADMPKIKAAIRASSERHRAAELDAITMAIEQGKPITDEDLEAAEYLTPRDIAKARKGRDKATPPTAEEHAGAWDILLKQRTAFNDPSISDADYAASYNDTRADVLEMIPPQYQGDISSELAQRSPANRNASKTKPKGYSEAPELKAIGLDRITRARTAGMFGNVGDDADPATKEKAFRRSEDLRLQVSRFVEKNPEATMEEVTTFTDGLISGDRVKTSARELQNFVPGAAQRLRPMVPLPGMAPGQGSASDALLPPRTQLENFLKPDQ